MAQLQDSTMDVLMSKIPELVNYVRNTKIADICADGFLAAVQSVLPESMRFAVDQWNSIESDALRGRISNWLNEVQRVIASDEKSTPGSARKAIMFGAVASVIKSRVRAEERTLNGFLSIIDGQGKQGTNAVYAISSTVSTRFVEYFGVTEQARSKLRIAVMSDKTGDAFDAMVKSINDAIVTWVTLATAALGGNKA